MRFLIAVTFTFLIIYAPLLRADTTAAQQGLLYKKLELNFEPVKVSLLEELTGNRLRDVEVPFKYLKISTNEETKYIVTVVGISAPDAKPLALLFVSVNRDQEVVEAFSSLIENRDVIDSSLIASLRENIIALRAKASENARQLSIKESVVNELKSKAASLARLSRLVEAQTTVSSLQRRLEGLHIDKANMGLLLEMVRQEQPSARLVSSEAALSRDLRLLSQGGAGAKKQKGAKLNEDQREAAKKIIQKAEGLNLEELREQVKALRNAELDQIDRSSSVPEPAADDDAKGLAEEYNRKHNLD